MGIKKEMKSLNKRHVIAAALLIAISLSTAAYATITLGVGVTIEDVDVSLVGVEITPKIPARTVYTKAYTDGASGLNVTGLANLATGDTLQIRVEVLVTELLADSVRNLIVVVDTEDDADFDTSDTIITMNNPWREFTYTVTGSESAGTKNFRVAVLITTGDTPVTSGSFNVIGSVVGFTAV
jgi:hypothetical protein